jgi:hypothetical protein
MMSRIFWFLLILFIATFVPFALFLPETCRHVVDNGSIPPPWFCSNVSDCLRFRKRQLNDLPIDQGRQAEQQQKFSFYVPNPMASLKIITDFESAILLVTLSLGKSVCSTPKVVGLR